MPLIFVTFVFNEWMISQTEINIFFYLSPIERVTRGAEGTKINVGSATALPRGRPTRIPGGSGRGLPHMWVHSAGFIPRHNNLDLKYIHFFLNCVFSIITKQFTTKISIIIIKYLSCYNVCVVFFSNFKSVIQIYESIDFQMMRLVKFYLKISCFLV